MIEERSLLVDGCGRRIECLRVSVTDRCNLRCTYCMPADGVALKQCRDMLSYERITEVVRVAARLGITRVRLTGGEPLVRRGVEDLVRMVAGVDGIDEVAMTSNAILLTPERARVLRDAGLDRLNISLDTLDPDRYRELTRGGDIAAALAGIDAAREAGFENTKINMVVFESTTEREILAMRAFCTASGLELQRIRHFSLTGEDLADHPTVCERPLPCDRCNRLRLTADGFLLPCLKSETEIEVDFDDIAGCFAMATKAKPPEGTSGGRRTMRQIGG